MMSAVEGFEQKTSQYLHRWLELPRSLSSIALQRQNKLTHPFSSVKEEFIVTCTREVLQYRESRDP